LVKGAKSVADKIKAALSAHENRKLAEEQKARMAALAEARAAEETARKAAEAGKPVPPPVTPPAPVPPAPEPVTQVRGAYGRAAAVKLVRIAVVTDQDVVYQAFRTNPDVVALLAKLAQKATDAGATLAGVTIEEQRKVV
jgi:hypothetical protein